MAVAYIQEFPIGDRSTVNYDFVAERVGEGPFEGLISHSAGFDDEAGVFRIFDASRPLVASVALMCLIARWRRVHSTDAAPMTIRKSATRTVGMSR